MEELEFLRENWNNSDDYKEYSEGQIQNMIKQKSVSTTKTLMAIGLIEFLLWGLYGYIDGKFPYFRAILFTVFFILIIYFFNKIKAEANSKSLMEYVLNLRKVIFGYAGISFFLIVLDNIINFKHYTRDFIAGLHDGKTGNAYRATNPSTITPEVGNYMIFGVILIIIIFFLYWLYKKTYGKILSDLKKNYKELNNIE